MNPKPPAPTAATKNQSSFFARFMPFQSDPQEWWFIVFLFSPGHNAIATRASRSEVVARLGSAWDGGWISLEFLDTYRKGLSNRLRQLRFAAVSSVCDGQFENLP